ncbi:MAG: DUF5939 domain-containing protein, partial [SAR324 cluster bacterium]|nr:DUF5939 domain-containing protein [SAR324 cluster bacterium]
MLARSIQVSVEGEFPVSVSQMWELLGNTQHLNRTISLPAFNYEVPKVNASDFYRNTSAKYFGITLRWKEYPFDWVINRKYSVRRVFEKGPLIQISGGIKLWPSSAGTRVRVFAEIIPRQPWSIFRPLISLVGRKNVNDVLNFCKNYETLLQSKDTDPLPRRPPSGVYYSVLQRAVSKLLMDSPAAPVIVSSLQQLMKEGTDDEVLRMRPYRLADKWGFDRDETLRTFLYATIGGLLELDWELMCPNCRVPKAEYRSFSDLASR